MKKSSKIDWLLAGFTLLSREGLHALTLERLAKELRLTKGSFYHHFKTIREYQEHILNHWQQELTRQVIKDSEIQGDPEQTFDNIVARMATLSAQDDPEQAIRSWASEDDLARSYVQRVDHERIEYGTSVLLPVIMDEQKARRLTIHLYALLIGISQLHPFHRLDWEGLYAEWKTLIPFKKA